MLDGCRLARKSEMEHQKLAQEHPHHRLNELDVVVSRELQRNIEINLGYQAEPEVVIELIRKMREEFMQKLSNDANAFERILARSAPGIRNFLKKNERELSLEELMP